MHEMQFARTPQSQAGMRHVETWHTAGCRNDITVTYLRGDLLYPLFRNHVALPLAEHRFVVTHFLEKSLIPQLPVCRAMLRHEVDRLGIGNATDRARSILENSFAVIVADPLAEVMQ